MRCTGSDPVFIIGQAFGVFVYLRNLHFVLRSGGDSCAAVAGNNHAGFRKRGEATLEIGNQVVGIFESDMKTDAWSARRPFALPCDTRVQSKGIARLSKPPHE